MATDPHHGRSVPLVERVRNILTQPRAEWTRIAAEPATIGGIYRGYVAILAAIPAVATVIGSLAFGQSLFGVTYRPPVGSVLAAAIVSYVFALIGVYILALVIEALAPSFGGTKDRVQAFKVAAYSGTPGWVAGILLVIPSLAVLVALAGLYGLYLLFVGLPLVMRSPADRSVGYIVAVIVAAIVVYIAIGALTAVVLGALMPNPGAGSLTVNLPG